MSISCETSSSDKALISFLTVDAGFTRNNARIAIEWLRLDKLTNEEKDVIFKIRLNPKDAQKADAFGGVLNHLNWRITNAR